ncbi:hypothetical protein Tco_1370460 [Tanacetum coccineum]
MECYTSSAEEIVPIPRESEDTKPGVIVSHFYLRVMFSHPSTSSDDSIGKNCVTMLQLIKAECFDPRGDNDEIDFSSYRSPYSIEKGYYDSRETDPLHHEFADGVIMIPPRIVRKHEDYISRMSLLCGNSSSRSPENFHTIIESLPISTTLVEDSDSNREEIDIFSGPDDSIPPWYLKVDLDPKRILLTNMA